MNPWPPFRTPPYAAAAYEDPRQILKSRVFHAVALVILYKAIRGHVSEHVMALVIFLLEQAVIISEQDENKVCIENINNPLEFYEFFFQDTKMCSTGSQTHSHYNDMDVSNWFTTDSLFENLKTVVDRVILNPEPDFSPITYSSDSKCFFILLFVILILKVLQYKLFFNFQIDKVFMLRI